MTRGTLVALAFGGLMLTAAPLTAANAQSGDALAHAERACSDAGVRPSSSAYNSCVDRAADDFYRGAPELAYDSAHLMGSATSVCAAYGLDPHSLGYSQCIENEMRRTPDTVQALSVIDDTPHAAVSFDSYGFGFDAEGNLLDSHGYVIKPVPYRP